MSLSQPRQAPTSVTSTAVPSQARHRRRLPPPGSCSGTISRHTLHGRRDEARGGVLWLGSMQRRHRPRCHGPGRQPQITSLQLHTCSRPHLPLGGSGCDPCLSQRIHLRPRSRQEWRKPQPAGLAQKRVQPAGRCTARVPSWHAWQDRCMSMALGMLTMLQQNQKTIY